MVGPLCTGFERYCLLNQAATDQYHPLIQSNAQYGTNLVEVQGVQLKLISRQVNVL